MTPRSIGRAAVALAAVAAASFTAGTLVAGDPRGAPATEPLRLANADLRLPGSCADLLDSYVSRGSERVGPFGWDFPIYFAQDGVLPERVAGDAAPAPAVVEQDSSDTGTNVQESGVDEPDTVKSDGSLLVRVEDGDLVVYDVTGAEPQQVGDTELPGGVASAELLLAGDRVVAVATADDGVVDQTHVVTYDVSDPSAPELVDHRGFDAGLVRAVQHGDTVRLVLESGLPDLDFVRPGPGRDDDEALAANKRAVAESSLRDWLPAVTSYDADGEPSGSDRLLDCSRVTVPSDDDATLGTTSVVGFEVDEPAVADSFAVATDTDLAYFSADRMYLATVGQVAWGCCVEPTLPPPGRPVVDDLGRSRIYAFALSGTDAAYVAGGAVDGVIADRWSMDEHDGVLRVALGPGPESGTGNSVVALREDGGRLEVIGRVDGLGVGQRIESVRWFDGLAIVVTFRQVDPLYAVDLTDPARPRLLGHLKVPGFSAYLHPISGQRLIGLGQDASRLGTPRGAQAALFDVSDLTAPRQTDVVRYPLGSVAGAASDPRQFTWLPDREVALAVVSRSCPPTARCGVGRVGWVSVLHVSGGSLTNRMVDVAHGDAVESVRLVPLPDGRVVLSTAAGVSFLDV